MKRFSLSVVCVLALGFSLACASDEMPAPDTTEMMSAANALDQAFVEAFNRGDAAAMSGLYWNSPDVVLFPPDALQARGLAAIENTNAKMFAAMPGMKIEVTESHQMPLGDVVVGWGLWRVTMPGADGATTEIVGRYTDVKAERDGKWVYLVDHASAPLPPPPAQ